MTNTNETNETSNELNNIDGIQTVLGTWEDLSKQTELATQLWFDNLKKFYMMNSFESMSDCIDKALYHSGFATSETAKLRADAPGKASDRNESHYDIQEGFKFINPKKALGKSGAEVMNSQIRSVSTGKKGKLTPKTIVEFATYKELKDYYYSVSSKSSTKATDKDGATDKEGGKGSGKGKATSDNDSAPTIEQCIALIALQYPSVGRIAKLAVEVNGSKNAEDLNKILNSIQIESPVYPDKPTTPKDVTPKVEELEELEDDKVTGLSPLHIAIIRQCESELEEKHGSKIDLYYAIGWELFKEYVELTIEEPEQAKEFKGLIMDAVDNLELIEDAIKQSKVNA